MKYSTAINMALGLAVFAVAGCGRSGDGMQQPANAAPMISAIATQSTDQDTPLAVEFSVSDRESPAASLTVSASAADAAVFPVDGVVVSGDATTRTLTLTPLEARTGAVTITVNVMDPQGASATSSFQVAVNAREASMRAIALDTFAKGEADDATTVNGLTVQQDADDPAAFAALLGGG